MIAYVDQISTLSQFVGLDEETGEPLAVQVWSEKVWTTEFAEAVTLTGLTLVWTACNIYLHGKTYNVLAGSYEFVADPIYSQSVVIWLDPFSADNLTVDVVLLDGLHESPAAPAAGDDILRLAWGTIGAGAAEMTLHVLRHVVEV